MRLFLLLPVLLMFPALASAAMYKYTDDKGRVVYSERPPPSGEAQLIKPPPPPASSPQPAAGATAQAQGEDTNSGVEDDEAARRRAESRRIKTENCAKARKMLQMYSNPQNRLLKRPDGSYERVTDERRQQGIDSARRSIQEFCD
ncbi:MAG: DUF4124 domain-containing protein [Gammaproteobacteria bacterium SHHR-1]